MTTALSAPRNQYYAIDSPTEIARWRPLMHWLLFLPHAVALTPTFATRPGGLLCRRADAKPHDGAHATHRDRFDRFDR
ncbi:MAG: hypothetical protein WKF60_13740 [Ilumatobacter sp.]